MRLPRLIDVSAQCSVNDDEIRIAVLKPATPTGIVVPGAGRPARQLMRNPLRSEGDMFRLLLYVIAVFGTVVAIILIARAL